MGTYFKDFQTTIPGTRPDPDTHEKNVEEEAHGFIIESQVLNEAFEKRASAETMESQLPNCAAAGAAWDLGQMRDAFCGALPWGICMLRGMAMDFTRLRNLGILLAVAVTAGGAKKHFTPPILPTISDTTPCRDLSHAPFSGPAVKGHVEATGLDFRLAVVVFDFSLDGNPPKSAHHGFLYYQLDKGPKQYIAFYAKPETDASVLIGFAGVPQGSHRIDYGLVSAVSSNVSYGRVCFTTHVNKNGFFDAGTP